MSCSRLRRIIRPCKCQPASATATIQFCGFICSSNSMTKHCWPPALPTPGCRPDIWPGLTTSSSGLSRRNRCWKSSVNAGRSSGRKTIRSAYVCISKGTISCCCRSPCRIGSTVNRTGWRAGVRAPANQNPVPAELIRSPLMLSVAKQ